MFYVPEKKLTADSCVTRFRLAGSRGVTISRILVLRLSFRQSHYLSLTKSLRRVDRLQSSRPLRVDGLALRPHHAGVIGALGNEVLMSASFNDRSIV